MASNDFPSPWHSPSTEKYTMDLLLRGAKLEATLISFLFTENVPFTYCILFTWHILDMMLHLLVEDRCSQSVLFFIFYPFLFAKL
jgi:hypothetical protein